MCKAPEEADHCTSDGKGACSNCNKAAGAREDASSNNYFLFYGGCYDQTNADLGEKLCSALQDNKDGTCKTAGIGAFIKNTKLYLCNDKTNGGTENCGTCAYDSAQSTPFTCSKCLDGFIVDAGKCVSCSAPTTGYTGHVQSYASCNLAPSTTVVPTPVLPGGFGPG